MAIRKFRTGQMSYAVGTYVGTAGTLFYDEDNGALRISDGVTPGGSPISYPIASSTQLGGIKLGPGVVLNGDGQIIIDSEGLDFSFGDLAATTGTYPSDYFDEARQDQDYAVLSSINSNEDIIFASNGTGAVRVVGDFSVRRANGNLISALDEQPIFRIKSDGQVQMLVPAADSSEGAVTIVGGLDGVFQAPVNTGVMLHITGIASSPDPTPSRIYNDAQNSFSAIVSRRYNGTAAAPSAVLDGEEIMRLSGTAHNGTLIPGTGNQRIVYTALGNQTLTNQGGAIQFWATPINTTTLGKVATVDSTGITLESGKVLTGNVTGTVSGNAGTATTLATARNINGVSFNGSADITVTAAAGTLTGNTLASGVTASSLTSVGTLGSLAVTNNITATNYTGLVTHSIRNAGAVGGTTLTLNVTTDDIVRCTFTTDFTVAFSNIVAGRVITLIATNTSGADTDVITSGIAALNTTSAGTFTVSPQTTAVITYYSLDGDTANIYASAVYE